MEERDRIVAALGKGEDSSFVHMLCDPAPSAGCYVTFATPLAILSITVCVAATARETMTARSKRVSSAVPWAAGAAMIANCVSSAISDPWLGSEVQGMPACSIVAILLWAALLGACATNSTKSASAPLVLLVMSLAVVGRVTAVVVAGLLSSSQAPKQDAQYLFFVVQGIVLLADAAVIVAWRTRPGSMSEGMQELLIESAAGSTTTGTLSLEGARPRPPKKKWQPPDGVCLEEEQLFPLETGIWGWTAAYCKMNDDLIARAKVINSGGRPPPQDSETAKQERKRLDGEFRESLDAVRRHVTELCPKLALAAGCITSTMLTVSGFLLPYFMGKLYDGVIETAKKPSSAGAHSLNEHLPLLITIASIMVFNYLGSILVGIFFAIAAHTTVTRLRVRLFHNLVRQDIAFYDSHTSGELSSRLLNDSARLQVFAQFTTDSTLQAMIRLLGSLAAMYGTHWKLALVATAIAPISWHLIRVTGRTVGYYSTVQNEAMAKASALAVEVLGAVRTVHANAGEPKEAVSFRGTMNGYLRVIKFTVYAETVLRFTDKGLAQVRDYVVLALGMYQVVNGQMTIGAYTAFASYVSIYEVGFSAFADLWITLKQTIASTGRFLQLLERQPAVDPDGGSEPEECMGNLSFEDVSFCYATEPDRTVLQDLSFAASPGTVTALVGESGAGKSTISRLIMRFYDPTKGRIMLDGRNYTQLSLRWLRTQIGFVEQEPVLFDRSLRDNLIYGSPVVPSEEQIRMAARQAHADDFIMALPMGYDTRPGEKGVRVSGGQKQRIAIARAILKDPRILLLDEATSALDSKTEHRVQGALDSLMSGRTTIVIAHRLSTVVNSNQIIVLSNGVAMERGTHAQLCADPSSHYASFMQHQLIPPSLEGDLSLTSHSSLNP